MRLLGYLKVISIVFCVVSRVLLCSCYKNILRGCQGVAMRLLGYSEWLPEFCCMVVKVLTM